MNAPSSTPSSSVNTTRKLVRRYLANVVRVAQFSAYERLFALWHVVHVPFIYIHWGFAMRQADAPGSLAGWGVVPSLVAWVAVVMPPYAGLIVLGAMLVACYLVDRRVYPAQGAAAWLTLRFRLTAVASLSCFIGAAGS